MGLALELVKIECEEGFVKCFAGSVISTGTGWGSSGEQREEVTRISLPLGLAK